MCDYDYYILVAKIKALKADWDNPFWCRVKAVKRKRSSSGKEPEEAEESDDDYADAEDFPGSDPEASDGSAVPSDDEEELQAPGGGAATNSKESGSESASVSEIPVVVSPSKAKKKVLKKKKGSTCGPRIVLKFGKGAGSQTKVHIFFIVDILLWFLN